MSQVDPRGERLIGDDPVVCRAGQRFVAVCALLLSQAMLRAHGVPPELAGAAPSPASAIESLDHIQGSLREARAQRLECVPRRGSAGQGIPQCLGSSAWITVTSFRPKPLQSRRTHHGAPTVW